MADPDWLVAQFADCAVAWGYCHASARSGVADTVMPDLNALALALKEATPDWCERLHTLMTDHPNPWVKHCAAALLLKYHPDAAIAVLERLSAGDGMWALSSQVALGTYRRNFKSNAP